MSLSVEQLRAKGVAVTKADTFDNLDRIADVFINGHNGNTYPFLIIIGWPGLGKSRHFENAKDCVYIPAAGLSPVGLYELAYTNRDKTLVFDDCEDIFKNKSVVATMKLLMNDRPIKSLAWAKHNTQFEANGIPKEFKTRSRCCIILNEIPRSFSVNDMALLSRGKFVVFKPSPAEVHKGAEWFKKEDSEIYDFIGANLRSIVSPHFRWYTNALIEKKTGADWRAWLSENWNNGEENPYLAKVAQLLAKHAKPGEQLREWKSFGAGYSRSQFFRTKAEYLAAHGDKPKIVLPVLATIKSDIMNCEKAMGLQSTS